MTNKTLPDLKKLREVALAATPGPWLYRGKSNSWHHVPPEGSSYRYGHSILDVDNELKEADVCFIQTFNPQTILALLDAYKASARDAERYRHLKSIVIFDHQLPRRYDVCAVMELHIPKEIRDAIGNSDYDESSPDLDQAIDAARHATQGD